jgi:HSP20 family protein
MALVNYRPYKELEEVGTWFDRFFDYEHSGCCDLENDSIEVGIKADVTENDDSYDVILEVPGLEKKEIKISVEKNVLSISGEKKTVRKDEKGQSLYKEIRYGKFERRFTLPDGVEADKINAHLENGLLSLVIPKSAKQKAREIEINVM